MASLSRFSPLANASVRSTGLTILAAGTGTIAWSGEPRLLPAAMLFPAFWALAPTPVGAAMVSAGYFLAASWALPQGVANFYGSGFGAGLALWLGAGLAFVIVHAALWTRRSGWRKAVRYGVALLLMSVPPFGIVGWAHPVTAAGILFPGWGWWGFILTALGLLAVTLRYRLFVLALLAGVWITSVGTWAEPRDLQGWIGIDTAFGGQQGEYAGYSQHRETLALVKDAMGAGNDVILLPENAAGIWTATTERLWTAGLAGADATVITGAIAVDRDGYDNEMVVISASGARTLYLERMPVPVSMWQPWRQWTGAPAGARAHFFANPIVEVASGRAAALICYEQLLIWPVLQSVLHDPDVIIGTGNGWWTAETNIVPI